MIDNGIFVLGSKATPMKPSGRNLKLGAGYASISRRSHLLTRTITPELDASASTVKNKQDTVVRKCDGRRKSSLAPRASEDTDQTTSPSENSAPNSRVGTLPKSDLNVTSKKNKTSSRGSARRRSIFSQFQKGEDDLNDDFSTSEHEQHPTQNILEFTPPLDHRYEFQKRFKMLDSFPLENSQDLPPLPTPLLRYTNEQGSGGVYPLVEPKSILRRGKFSPQNEPSSLSISDDNNIAYARSESASSHASWMDLSSHKAKQGLNLSNLEQISRNMNLEESKQFFRKAFDSNTSGHEPLVKFDPRIVITEFPDEERAWFTEDDLNRFKKETLILAQHYMMLHPQLAEEYNLPKIDQITGKLRKKALFALPGLCSADGLDSFGSSEEIERLLKNSVRKILIVDPNKSILRLFEKGMYELFPDARITLVESGEEALRLYAAELQRQNNRWDGRFRGFDIVIVEERLNRQRMKYSLNSKQRIRHGFRLTRMRSDSSDYANSEIALKTLEEKGIPKQDSEFNLRSLPRSDFEIPMSGSQLIQRIHEAEETFYNQSKEPANDDVSEDLVSVESSVFSPPQRWSLLIGVSVNVDRDGQKLKDSGADLVWSKPPPTIGVSLRNKLISCLISKRQLTSFCVKIPGD